MDHQSSLFQEGTSQRPELADAGEQRLLEALSDPLCRQILQAASDQAMTATELADALKLPLSTIYRKLEILSETAVIEGTYRVSNDGHHATEYRADIGHIQITLSESDDTVLTVDRYADSK